MILIKGEDYNKGMTGRKTGEIVSPTLQPKMPGFEPAAVVKTEQAQAVAEVKPETPRGLVISPEWEKRRMPGEPDVKLWKRMRRETEEQDRDLPYQAVK